MFLGLFVYLSVFTINPKLMKSSLHVYEIFDMYRVWLKKGMIK